MPPLEIGPKLLSWASEIDDQTADQAGRTARLPFIAGHVALMPDAHYGYGSTVGSVIPTEGAIIPAAVGVDIGCGMVASETDLNARDLPDDLGALLSRIEEIVPAGVGKAHESPVGGQALDELGIPGGGELTDKQVKTLASQFGTLGSGNHFVEVCLDERDQVWTVLHSGSRGIGNQLATRHMQRAKGLMEEMFIGLEDPDLAYLVQGSDEFNAYIRDMLWAQRYAMASRQLMAERTNAALTQAIGHGQVRRVINCHHNFTQEEEHDGRKMWITRKGAIKADLGDEGVIPGSMGTRSYIVSGLGNPLSYNSCSHGAGRRLSRGKAKRTLSVESLQEAMEGRTWNADKADQLVDEHPDAYKSIDQVMEDQRDLVSAQHTLRQILNYKGTN